MSHVNNFNLFDTYNIFNKLRCYSLVQVIFFSGCSLGTEKGNMTLMFYQIEQPTYVSEKRQNKCINSN